MNFFFFFGLADFRVEGRPAASHADPHARSQAVQMFAVLEGVRQQFVPVAAHAHPSGHQTVPLRDLPAQVHAAQSPAAAHSHPHGRQAVQVPPSGLQQGLLAAQQPAVALALPPDGQTLQVQFVLQVLHRRNGPPRTHSQAQRIQASQDSHLPVLRQVLHAGDLPPEAHAEARRTLR